MKFRSGVDESGQMDGGYGPSGDIFFGACNGDVRMNGYMTRRCRFAAVLDAQSVHGTLSHDGAPAQTM